MSLARRVVVLTCIAACARGTMRIVPETPARRDARPGARADLPASATLVRASQARELVALRGVDEVLLSRAELLAKLRAHVERTVPRAEIESEDLFLKALGVLGRDEDYERRVYAALATATSGMYEPEGKRIFLADDLDGKALGASMLHEAVHALQDQHFDLAASERYVPGATDTLLARSCLAEGDATSATHDATQDDEPGEGAMGTSYIDHEIAAPYVLGTAFVRALRKRGGWAEVNMAWTRGDLTTEQVIHPEKWFVSEPAESVFVPSFTALGRAATRIATDVRGELGLRLVLEAAMPDAAAAEVSAGWGGDSLVLVREGGRVDLAWRIRFDDEAHARVANEAIAHAFAARACAVTRSLRDVLLLIGPVKETCARWSVEIMTQGP